jgi:hypothetical protein
VTAELGEELTSKFAESQPIWDNLDHRMRFFVDHPELARLVLQHLLSESPIPERAWTNYLEEIREIAESENAQPDIDAEMLSYVLSCVGILWPVIVRAQYEDTASVHHATRRLTRELRRLLLRGVLRPEAWLDPDESIDAPKSRG